MIRGAFEFQGQKCSAASRAYVARSVWERMRDDLVAETEAITMGDVTDLSNFMGAVIDARAFAKHDKAIARAKGTDALTVLAGGTLDDSVGWFVRPTIIESSDPEDEMFNTEYFGPILVVHVYEDGDFERVVDQMESFAPYALTGSIIAQDRRAVAWASERLRFAAGNFYVNDKPTGAVVGQQPFGGGRASGTNDKAGAAANLHALDVTAQHQGDVRRPEGLPLPAHGALIVDGAVVEPAGRRAHGCAAPRGAGAGRAHRVRPVRGAGGRRAPAAPARPLSPTESVSRGRSLEPGDADLPLAPERAGEDVGDEPLELAADERHVHLHLTGEDLVAGAVTVVDQRDRRP